MAMSSKTILSGADFTPASDIKYSKPKVDARGGKSVGILNASANTATYISTPLMLTWGVSDYEGNERYEMALQFPNTEYATPDTTNFMNNMIDFEKKMKADAITNAKEWFGKAKMSEDAIDALWTPMLKYPKDKNTLEPDLTRAPTLKVKVPFWEGEWKTELYNVDQEAIFPDPEGGSMTPKDLIVKGTHVALVLQCGGLWFANGKFGVTWKLFQGVVKPKATMRGKCHIQLSGEDKEKMVKQSIPDDEIEEEDDEPASTEVEDSDDEGAIKTEVAAVVQEPEPVKKKVIKKKVVKKSAD
tara:strand:+ start:2518 stop:3417 length:900 start_codon:yes stop_codon:yes gene_type:complete